MKIRINYCAFEWSKPSSALSAIEIVLRLYRTALSWARIGLGSAECETGLIVSGVYYSAILFANQTFISQEKRLAFVLPPSKLTISMRAHFASIQEDE